MKAKTNEDERRKLFSFPEGKVLDIKKDCVVGRHYHKIKTEFFLLSRGACTMLLKPLSGGELDSTEMRIGELYRIKPFQYHEFHIKKGSILVGLNSHVYNPDDDYKNE
jgi:D-lyxose ketol-isomerase